MTTVHVVRHGRTAANAGGLLLGRLDPPLDSTGEEQAAAVGASLAAWPSAIERVVSSPLQRCRATAEVIARMIGVDDVELDPRWIELDYGELDGVAIRDVPADTWATWRADVTWRPPAGESLIEVGARVRSACDDLAVTSANTAGDVVVVTHVSPLKAAVAWALGVGDGISWRLFVAPGSITRIALRPDTPPAVHAFNVIPG